MFLRWGGSGQGAVRSRAWARRWLTAWSLVHRSARGSGGEQRSEDPVVDLGVEDREPDAGGSQGVAVVVGDAGDQAVAAQPGKVVAGLVHAVGGAEQSGHQGAQALVGDAGDGEQRVGQGAGQGLDPRVAEPQGWGPAAIVGDGGLRDPRKGWTRKDRALADPLECPAAAG